jgi:hypothetical protein
VITCFYVIAAVCAEEIKSAQAEMRSIVNVWLADMKDGRKETMSCELMTEACLDNKELNLEDMKPKVEYQETSTEEAAVKYSGTMK